MAHLLASHSSTSPKLAKEPIPKFEFFKKNPHFLVAIFSDGLLEESKAINEAILQIMGTKRKPLLQIIQQGQKQKQFTDALASMNWYI